jgi:hypothetical protein
MNPTASFVAARKIIAKKKKKKLKGSQLRRIQLIASNKGGQALLLHIMRSSSTTDVNTQTDHQLPRKPSIDNCLHNKMNELTIDC